MKKHIAIVGGGLLGLTLAYKLSKQDYDISLFEKDDTFGGLAGSVQIEGTNIEKFYHHIFKSDTDIQDLLEELELGSDLQWRKSAVGVSDGDHLYDFFTDGNNNFYRCLCRRLEGQNNSLDYFD